MPSELVGQLDGAADGASRLERSGSWCKHRRSSYMTVWVSEILEETMWKVTCARMLSKILIDLTMYLFDHFNSEMLGMIYKLE